MRDFNPKDYWEKRLKHNFDAVGVGDNGLGTRYNEWLYSVRKTVFINKMKTMDMNLGTATVLDIGPGTGFYIDRWKELDVKSIVGADITQVVVENLSKKYPDVAFFQVDIGDSVAPLEQYEFDLISAFDVLFHIVDDEQFARAVKNIYSLLKPDGLFVFSDNFLHGESLRTSVQVSRSLSEIEALVRDTGFEILARFPMFVLMANPVDSNSQLMRVRWRITAKLCSTSEIFGFLLGAFYYPLELLSLSIVKEGPTTEMMICRKPD